MKLKKDASFAAVMYDYDGEKSQKYILQTARACIEIGLRSERVELGMVRGAVKLAQERGAEIDFIVALAKFVDKEALRLWGEVAKKEHELNGPPN